LATSAAAFAAPAGRPIRLGGPIFLKSEDPREVAKEHRRLGYSAGYVPGFAKTSDPQMAREIEKAFAAENVVIAEVGAWKNILDPDPQKRRENLAYVIDRLALADMVNARCCVDIAGSYNSEIWYGPHPENLSQKFFDETVENCRKIIDEIKPKRTKFTIEMMGWNLPDSTDSYLKLIRAVDRPAFGVHLDPFNLVNSPTRFYRNAELIQDCFDKLGRWIVSCHAKDLAWNVGMNIHFVEVIPGRGKIDYQPYLKGLAALPVDAPLMLEHLSKAEEYEEGKRYILSEGRKAGVTFA
jgi:sugar phosphate isomerase/epimerase